MAITPIKKHVASVNNVENKKAGIYSLVVDGNNLLKIALVNHRENREGKDYGAVIMFLKMLGDILKKKDFYYCIVCWDGEGSGVLRWKIYKDYKANRDKHYEQYDPDMSEYDRNILNYQKLVLEHAKDKRAKNSETEEECFERQKRLIQSILEELCIRQYEHELVEGDDLISYYVHHRKDNEKVVIVSSDKDLTQLINDNVIVYNPRIKDFITVKNAVEKIGIRHDNVVIEKMICGDDSDNIKGVKGVGESTLRNLFPELTEKKVDLAFITSKAIFIQEERAKGKGKNKKKPLQSLDNILNAVTDGIQGIELYNINRKLIDLSEPMLTDECKKYLDEVSYALMDTSDRDMKNVYQIVKDNDMYDIVDETKFGDLFAPYMRVIMQERRRYAKTS